MGSEYRDMADMRKQAASAALEEEGASRALAQQERFDATKSKLPMEHFLQALVGAAPVPTTEYSGALAAGTAPIAWPLLEEPLSEMDTQDRRRETQQRFADSASDAENARLDKEYYRAMAEKGSATQQQRRALGTIDDLGLKTGAEFWQSGAHPSHMEGAIDEVFEGAEKSRIASSKMDDLKKLGKVAMKSAYVGPWLAMAEAAGGAAAIPFLAADNYMKIKDPAEQIRFMALHGVQRPLEPGDLSPHGLAWLDSHTPQTNALYRQGILGAELYQTLMRPEGLEAAKQEAQAAYDSAEKWTPSKEQIQSLSR